MSCSLLAAQMGRDNGGRQLSSLTLEEGLGGVAQNSWCPTLWEELPHLGHIWFPGRAGSWSVWNPWSTAWWSLTITFQEDPLQTGV